MRKSVLLMSALLLALSPAMSQDTTTGGDELRFRFEKGQEFAWTASHKMELTMEEIPPEFEGLFGEDPVQLESSMVLDLKVVDVKDGKAVVEGEFEKLSIRGNLIFQELDFAYDRSKREEKKQDKDKKEEEEMPSFGPDIEGTFKKLVKEALRLTIDERGVIELLGAEGKDKGGMSIARQFLTLNGFMGPLPQKKVAKGDTWKNSENLLVPNLPFKLRLDAQNEVAEKKAINEQECVVIRSRYSVGSDDKGKEEKEKEGEESGLPYAIEAKLEGKGEGVTNFSLKQGMILSGKHDVKVGVNATMENPSTAEKMNIKASLTVTLTSELCRILQAERQHHEH